MTNVHTFQADGDYAPILVAYKEEVLMTGDNIHEDGFDFFAEGYAKALNVNVNSHWIEDLADLETHEEVLKKAGMYENFKEYIDRLNYY